MGQLKKSRRGVPPNLSGLRARAEGRSAATRDRNRLSRLGCEGAGRAGLSATSGRSARQFQVVGTARRAAPLRAGDKRRPGSVSAPARRPLPRRAKLSPNPIRTLGPNLSRVAFSGSRPRTALTPPARCPSAKKAEARERAGRRSEARASPSPQRATRGQVSAWRGPFPGVRLLLHGCRRPRPALRMPTLPRGAGRCPPAGGRPSPGRSRPARAQGQGWESHPAPFPGRGA